LSLTRPTPAWAKIAPHAGDDIGIDTLAFPGGGFLPIAGMTYGLINVPVITGYCISSNAG